MQLDNTDLINKKQVVLLCLNYEDKHIESYHNKIKIFLKNGNALILQKK